MAIDPHVVALLGLLGGDPLSDALMGLLAAEVDAQHTHLYGSIQLDAHELTGMVQADEH